MSWILFWFQRNDYTWACTSSGASFKVFERHNREAAREAADVLGRLHHDLTLIVQSRRLSNDDQYRLATNWRMVHLQEGVTSYTRNKGRNGFFVRLTDADGYIDSYDAIRFEAVHLLAQIAHKDYGQTHSFLHIRELLLHDDNGIELLAPSTPTIHDKA